MLSHSFAGKDLVVQNQFYRAILSGVHGGTLRSLQFNGTDIGLTREGYEYWSGVDEDHYEQEFSPTADVKVLDEAPQDFLLVEVKARLVQPRDLADGGYCRVMWLFRDRDPLIYTEHESFPVFPVKFDNRYVCFYPSIYSEYSLAWEGGMLSNSILSLLQKPRVETNLRFISVHSEKHGFAVMGDLGQAGVWLSKSMLEMKATGVNRVFYLPFQTAERETCMKMTYEARNNRLRETRLKAEILKAYPSDLWFKKTLTEHAHGIWFNGIKEKYLRDGMRVVDLAGGIGAWGAYLLYVDGYALHYTNVDSDPERIEASRRLFDSLGLKGTFIAQDIATLPPQNGDAALCFSASYYFSEDLFRIVGNTLKTGGLFIFNMIEKSTNRQGYSFALDMPEIDRCMRSAGFEVLEMEYLAKYDSFNDIGVVGRKVS